MNTDAVETIAGIDLDRAVRALRQRAQPDIEDLLHCLGRLRIFTQSVKILEQYQTELFRLPEKINHEDIAKCLQFDQAFLSSLEENAVMAISTVFPVFDSQTMDNILNLEDDYAGLVIMPQGMNFDYDELDYLLSNMDEMPKDQSILWFCKLIDMETDMEIYMQAAQYFGWPEYHLPKTVYNRGRRRIDSVDGDQLVKKLIKAGLQEIATCFHLAWMDTDNVFFDSSEEDAYVNADPYSLESVQHLEQAWINACEIRQHIEFAKRLPETYPGIYDKIIDIWDSCIIYEKKPKTLVDAWGAEMLEAGRIRAIDPFYGPLDGQDDDEETDEDEEDDE